MSFDVINDNNNYKQIHTSYTHFIRFHVFHVMYVFQCVCVDNFIIYFKFLMSYSVLHTFVHLMKFTYLVASVTVAYHAQGTPPPGRQLIQQSSR